MRAFALFALLLPAPALADTILASSHITAVTIYPQGAQVVREVRFIAPPGPHELLITDLPADIEPGLIRLSSADTQLGAFALRTDRLPPREEPTSPAIEAAKAAVKGAEAKVRQAQAAVDAINAEVEAGQAKVNFLTGLKLDGAGATAESLSGIARMIGTEVLAARQAAQAAQAGLPDAEQAVTDAQDVLSKALDALAALSKADEDYAALSVAVTTTGGGEAQLTVTHYVYDASWQPVYDMTLDRKAATLAVNRGVLVSQASGEDWMDVTLTLSTARPSDRSEPSPLWPELKQIGDPVEVMSAPAEAADGMAMAEPAMTVSAPAMPVYQGDTLVYHYPSAVDVATGVENLRLALDQLNFTPKLQARAVPRHDSTAFLVASVTNDSQEILLPGEALLYRDGALVGGAILQILSPGDKAELGFGAIDGIRLTRDMPQRAEGDRGIISTSTQIEEKAVLKVENLTDETWPVRLMDQVPYSEQEDLEISFTADPEVSEQDVDGKRGILAWDFDLAPGEKKEVTLDSLMSWPQGKVLR